VIGLYDHTHAHTHNLEHPDLSPEIHINGIVRAAYAFLSNVRVAFRHMDKEMFRNIYVTY
ncbi:hypothetical protein SK128_021629, partial [Halocaridina rubra]